MPETVTVVDIGIPAGAPVDPDVGLIGAGILDAIPRRGRESTKFAAGSVLVCGGSLGLDRARPAWPRRRRCGPGPAT